MSPQLRKLDKTSRRGITLIFVVTMIVLFLLMGTTFVIIANDYLKSARKRSVKHIYESDSQAILERAFYELARGPALSNANSPLRGHSLLADMYGYGVSATVATAVADSSEHFIVLTLNGDAKKLIDGSDFNPDPVTGSMSGLLLGVVSGPAKGLTTRIVDHQVDGDSSSGYLHKFVVLPSRIDSGFDVSNAASLVGTRIVINGRPFSGSGAGHYNPYMSRWTAALSNSALRPNQIGRTHGEILGKTGSGYFSIFDGSNTVPNSMGPNESYDTFDFQNMFLAGIKPDGTIDRSSFHRPELLANKRGDFRAFKKGGINDDGVAVDNNNDGNTDGIWMDIGLPVENRPDGICVKPLVSYLVLDLDGRINLNAHGSLLRDGDHLMSEIGLLGNPVSNLKRGQGYGPPEISMGQLLGLAHGGIMQGSASHPGRYGPDGFPGEANVRDTWSSYKLFGYPEAEFGGEIPGTVDRHFGSAMDVHGRFATGYPKIFDLADDTFPIGMPVTNVGFSDLANEIVDSPYEMTFSEGNAYGAENRRFDTPYTAGELEAVFRMHDPDSQLLPRRLLELGMQTSSAKHSVTTHSFEVPTTYENLPAKLYEILNSSTSDPSLGIPTSTPNRDATIRTHMRAMLPPEVFRGLPMNVNRPFGDGIDNNGNGVIDEMGESDMLTHPNGSVIEFDHDNDSISTSDFDSLFARITFAKHLYIVTLLNTERVDRNGDGMVSTADWYDFNEDGTTDDDDWIGFRKVVAQWVANVVDFRDPDSIMTPFEFDLNPWNGYDVDGSILTTNELPSNPEMRYTCWGAERPELLISETMATHDRRTQDLETETVPEGQEPARIIDGDTDFDSHLVPKVSAFFELYNPWVINDANQIRPAELYDETLGGVDLQKTSQDGSSPVWRLVVTEIGEQSLDPDDPSRNPGSKTATGVRRIYFARPSFTVDSGPEVYFPADDLNVGYVGPGRYAVVGTAGQKVGDRYDTYFGRRLTLDALTAGELHKSTRRISLDPSNRELQLVQWDPDEKKMTVFTRSVVNLPIGLNEGGWERELGVSDPVEGYYNLKGKGGIAIDLEPIEDGWKFTENVSTPGTPTNYAFDEPVDHKIDPDHYDEFLMNDGIIGADAGDSPRAPYRVVHLQRLANPLLAFDELSNPYRTIDTCGIDLFAFNGADTIIDPNNTPGIMRFGTHERRGSQDSDHGQKTDRSRLLFKSDLLGLQDPEEDADLFYNQADDHIFSWNFIESFGGLNTAYMESPTASGEPEPFCWLTWNNRPFVSHLELANVPHTSSYWMTRSFDMSSDGTDRDVYNPPTLDDARDDNPDTEAESYSPQFPHLLNFYADVVEGENNGPSLHRVFDYLEVPSRFIGTESYVNPATFANDDHDVSFGLAAPFDTISNYRYPGKININTVLDPKVWNGLMGGYATDPFSGVTYPQWEDSRNGSSGSYKFSNPYRSASASNLVPRVSGANPNELVVDPVQCGLFRAGEAGPTSEYGAMFDYNTEPKLAFANDDRAAYFRNDMRQRLGNLVTTRSSVFAIWITVGYFEVNSDGSMKSGSNGQGVEAGHESGEVHRPRAFFMMDRSIPVAFEPGKNHNIDRAVLVKTLIE